MDTDPTPEAPPQSDLAAPARQAVEDYVAGWHVIRSWNPPDPFAPYCGCEIAACGFVKPREICEQHGPLSGKTIRNGHTVEWCEAFRKAE